MKILAITALYPPYHSGGYEIRTKNIMDGLSSRGHEILVITSQKDASLRLPEQKANYAIRRKLRIRVGKWDLIDALTRWRITHILGMSLSFVRELFFDMRDLEIIDRLINHFQPDVIYLGHISPLSRTIMPYLADCKIPIVFDEGGSGLLRTRDEPGILYKFIMYDTNGFWLKNTIKSLVIKFICEISEKRIKSQWVLPGSMRTIFNSQLNLNNAIKSGLQIYKTSMIHSGIETDKFRFVRKNQISSPVVILVPGRILPLKGQIDAIKLLSSLKDREIDARVIFAGNIWDYSYMKEISLEIERLNLEDRVTFFSMMTQEHLAMHYQQADICFFPSYQRTGFSRTPLEAMACGCIVISYGNEGSDEIIRDKHNGFIVQAGDYEKVVSTIKELISSELMVKNINLNARIDIDECYSMNTYVSQIEEVVKQAALDVETIREAK